MPEMKNVRYLWQKTGWALLGETGRIVPRFHMQSSSKGCRGLVLNLLLFEHGDAGSWEGCFPYGQLTFQFFREAQLHLYPLLHLFISLNNSVVTSAWYPLGTHWQFAHRSGNKVQGMLENLRHNQWSCTFPDIFLLCPRSFSSCFLSLCLFSPVILAQPLPLFHVTAGP